MALIISHGRLQFSYTFNFLIHVRGLGHSICSIKDTEYAVGCTNHGKGGGRELGQRGVNPDFTSSLAPSIGPASQSQAGQCRGSPRANSCFQRGWALFSQALGRMGCG